MNRFLLFLMIAMLFLTLGCRLPKKRVDLPLLPVNEACADFTVDQQWDVIEATPRIRARKGKEGCIGSGVVVAAKPLSEDRGWSVYILTAAHVIEGMDSFEVEFFTRYSHPDVDMTSDQVWVVSQWKNQDMAILIVETPDRPAGILFLCPPRRMPKPGQPALAVGCGDGASPYATVGFLEHRWVMSDMSVSAPMIGGMSGGPMVVNVDGHPRLIGINCSNNPFASFAVPLEIITLLLHRAARIEPALQAVSESPTMVEPPLWSKRFIYVWFVALSLFLGGRKL